MSTESTIVGTWLSVEAHERLNRTLEELTGPVRADIVRKIEAAREEGDLKENGGYHAAKEEQGKLEARITILKALLRDARGGVARGDLVAEGCVVTLDYGDNDLETFLYASRENASDEGGKIGDLDVFSPASPLGQAINGHKVGDVVTFGDRNITVTIRSIEPYVG